MSWWRRLLAGRSGPPSRPQRVDYLREALALERQGNTDAALTSYRLALRDFPNDPKILQNLAIACTRTGRLDEALRSYKRALELDPKLSGAHYGLAFLLMKRGDRPGTEQHLRAFLAHPPTGDDAERWVTHARATLEGMQAGTGPGTMPEPE
jgi:Flp pilus assembly protein TadD